MASSHETGNWTSTYRDDFSDSSPQNPVLPPLPYFQDPCLTTKKDKLPARCFPISLPPFPKRPRDGEIPIASGFETFVHRTEQLRQDVYHQTPDNDAAEGGKMSYHNVPESIFDDIVHLATYTPSSQLSGPHPPASRKKGEKLSAIFRPPTSREKRADVVRHRPMIYEEKPEVWQRVGCYWDKSQERPGCTEMNKLSPEIAVHPSPREAKRLLSRPRIDRPTTPKTPSRSKSRLKDSACRKNSKEKSVTVRFIDQTTVNQIPGYGGYISRLPMKPRMVNGNTNESMAQETYRNYGASTYKPPMFGHNGPLSRTVTRVYPFNPFNKVTKQEIILK